MKNIKKLFLTNLLIFSFMPIAFAISCASAPADYKVMAFIVDDDKLKKENENASNFNNELITKNKLLKIIKNENLDRYTLEALGYSKNDNYKTQDPNKNLFKLMEIDNNKLYIKIETNIKVIVDGIEKIISSPYRLPNKSTEMKIEIK